MHNYNKQQESYKLIFIRCWSANVIPFNQNKDGTTNVVCSDRRPFFSAVLKIFIATLLTGAEKRAPKLAGHAAHVCVRHP